MNQAVGNDDLVLNEQDLNPLSTNPTKWLNTKRQIADELFECV